MGSVNSDQWEEGFSYLKEFSDERVIAECLNGYKTDDGYRLGQWVAVQRQAKDTMDPDRRQRLEALPGWSWDVHSEQWEEGFFHLKEFSDREGHCRVRQLLQDRRRLSTRSVGYSQRRAKDTMDTDRRQRLEALPGWSWDVLSEQWEEGFSHLKQFSEREGHCRVPQRYKTDDGYRLGQWVSVQRQAKDTMESDRRQRLEALPGWSWAVRSDAMGRRFLLSEAVFRPRRSLPSDSTATRPTTVIDSVSGLGIREDAKDTMDPDRRQRLEALPGWSWDVFSDQWEEGFSYLKKFSEREVNRPEFAGGSNS